MKAFWLLCMCLCATYSINAQGFKNLESDHDSIRNQIISYELSFFEGRGDSVLLKKAYAYKSLGLYEEALVNLNRINSIDVAYEKALLHYLKGDIESSYNQFLRLGFSQENHMTSAHHLLYMMLLIKKNEYQSAKAYLLEEYNFGLTKDQIDSVFSKKNRVKNPEKAYNISLFLPGLGQAYAGYPGRGMISGIMQAGSAGFTYYSLVNQYYFSGVLTGAALFYTFYLGGARYAKNLAIQKNRTTQNQIIDALQDVIKKANP